MKTKYSYFPSRITVSTSHRGWVGGAHPLSHFFGVGGWVAPTLWANLSPQVGLYKTDQSLIGRPHVPNRLSPSKWPKCRHFRVPFPSCALEVIKDSLFTVCPPLPSLSCSLGVTIVGILSSYDKLSRRILIGCTYVLLEKWNICWKKMNHPVEENSSFFEHHEKVVEEDEPSGFWVYSGSTNLVVGTHQDCFFFRWAIFWDCKAGSQLVLILVNIKAFFKNELKEVGTKPTLVKLSWDTYLEVPKTYKFRFWGVS